jgi:light-regulated signal transduction histidine kinase (bacteriophytochrome)
MKAAAARMQALIDDLLSYSRLTTKAAPFVRVDLDALVLGCVSDLEIAIDRASGTVEVSALGVIEADPHQMRQLFQNLIENALKYRRSGVPPVVRIVGRRESTGGTERLVVDISDNGIGFDPRHKDRIFLLFERLHAHQQYEGTGLGLAICRKIVERHRGCLTATGTPDAGSVFHLELPTSQPIQPPEAP